ncbi:MAG: hypothetical protein WCH65_03485 [bacterium]
MKKTTTFLVLLCIGSAVIGQIIVEYKRHHVLYYYTEDIKKPLIIKDIPIGVPKQKSKTLISTQNKYREAYAGFIQHPKQFFNDTLIQQNFLYNIEIINILLTKNGLFDGREISQKQEKLLCKYLDELVSLIETGTLKNKKNSPEYFDELNLLYAHLDDVLYEIFM